MDVIIEDNVLYRFKKKWVNRYCKLVKTNNFSDSVKLLIFTYDENKRLSLLSRKSYQMISKHVVYGHLHGIHLQNETHVMFVVCKNSVECLAFRDFSMMKAWSDQILKHLNDISQPVTLIYSDKYSQLKPKLDGRLLLNCSHISFIRDPSCSEPKLLMSWKISDIMEFGCSKDIKKNSSKSKLKSQSIDLSQNVFLIKASPLCHKAPNNHVFTCHSPKLFCDRLENISLNQENLQSPNDYDLVMQRSRTNSYSTIQSNFRSSEWCNSDIDYNLDSPLNNSHNRFFSEATQPRVPRFQRSVSEAPRTRYRMDSPNSIHEENEIELTDYNVSFICKASGSMSTTDMQSPTSSGTFTFLERYPYERAVSSTSNSRLTSETNINSYRTFNIVPLTNSHRMIGPKSSSNYCSLTNLRRKSRVSYDSSPPGNTNTENTLSNTKEEISLQLDKSQGLIYRRSMKPTNSYSNTPENQTSGYVNLEFSQLFEQINQFCSVGCDIDKSQKTSGILS